MNYCKNIKKILMKFTLGFKKLCKYITSFNAFSILLFVIKFKNSISLKILTLSDKKILS